MTKEESESEEESIEENTKKFSATAKAANVALALGKFDLQTPFKLYKDF